jgi:FAD/FMN-containing dehydrogenase
MLRRTFCQSAIAAAVSTSLSACGARQQAGDPGPTISAVSMNGEELSLESSAVADFSESLQGRLFLQGDDGYDAAKLVWNGMFNDKKPSMVAQCASTDDVVNAVNFARENNLLVSVRGGGHSLPGKSTSDGGMMINLSQMHSTDVDTAAMTLRADGGSLLGHIDTAASAHNTMTTTGIVSHTGAGGFTLGGGIGRTDRKHGLAVDNLLAATIVTAGGEVLRASAEENQDLFWGIRGGGGNFGVATEFVYRLHPFNPVVYGGDLFFDLTPEFLEFYAELHQTLPDEASLEPQLNKDEDGNPFVMVEVVWCGDHAEGEKVLSPLLAFAGFRSGKLAPFPYRDIQTRFDGPTAHGIHVYLKSSFLKELTPEVIEIIVDYASRDSLAGSWFQHMGGANSRGAPDATAFAHRDVAFNFGIMYGAPDGANDEAGKADVREYYKAMEPHFAGFYTNLNDDDERKTWGNYGANYPRLVEVKNRYDPTNMFRLNANIKPTV